MHTITVRNVNQALSEGFWRMRSFGVTEQSRNGPVLVAPGPVMTIYKCPWERVLFNPTRDANPVFHLVEALWMIAGRNDVKPLLAFNSKFAAYAENDGLQHGAYGRRWRSHFGVDQISMVVNELRRDPQSRRAVIGMWDPEHDLGAQKRDVPCNTTIYFEIRGGALEMTVCCRSNDMLWGAYGANAVHMSILQELIACELRVQVGVYRQFSNNFHLYTDLPIVREFLDAPPSNSDKYAAREVVSHSLLLRGETLESFTDDCEKLVGILNSADGHGGWQTAFFQEIASPVIRAFLDRKATGKFEPVKYMGGDVAVDWHVAYNEWAQRRNAK
jgi:hypothetical protein